MNIYIHIFPAALTVGFESLGLVHRFLSALKTGTVSWNPGNYCRLDIYIYTYTCTYRGLFQIPCSGQVFSLDKEIESEAGHQGNGFETPASTQVPSVFAGVFFRNTAGKVHGLSNSQV
jgi:hypothetical protein